MPDVDLVEFLAWALPRMGLRSRGFANFRSTLRKRIARRVAALGLPDLASYRARLEADPSEWPALDALCRITISRLYRDRAVMERLGSVVLPEAVSRGRGPVRVWSAGCASGEEPYTLALLWRACVAPRRPDAVLEVVATDADPTLLERARRGVYASGSLRELPAALRDQGLAKCGEDYAVRDEVRRGVTFLAQDLRVETPAGDFDVILCRNLAFTYFDAATQERLGRVLAAKLVPAGVLVIGQHESLPNALAELVLRERCIYVRAPS